jgi:hypothetical protein
MTNEHTPTLQNIATDRDCWYQNAGAHCREVAHWLRGVAAKCRLPSTQRELLGLASRYERRAGRFEKGWL